MATRRSEQSQDTETEDGGIRELSYEEGWALLDERAREFLGIGADEFLHRWDAGEYANVDRSEVIHVAMLIPFARA